MPGLAPRLSQSLSLALSLVLVLVLVLVRMLTPARLQAWSLVPTLPGAPAAAK